MPWSQVQLINFETRKHIRTPKRRKRTRKVDPENCMPAEIEWQSNRIKWKEKHWFQIHLCTCVTAYVHVQWHTSSEIRFSKSVIFASYIAKCLISYRVHGAHTLLIDVISYSNNDTALSLSRSKNTCTTISSVYAFVFGCTFLSLSTLKHANPLCHRCVCVLCMYVQELMFSDYSSNLFSRWEKRKKRKEKRKKWKNRDMKNEAGNKFREMNEMAITFLQANNQCGTWELYDMDLMAHILLLNGISWVSMRPRVFVCTVYAFFSVSLPLSTRRILVPFIVILCAYIIIYLAIARQTREKWRKTAKDKNNVCVTYPYWM